jgi:hypothetical protein
LRACALPLPSLPSSLLLPLPLSSALRFLLLRLLRSPSLSLLKRLLLLRCRVLRLLPSFLDLLLRFLSLREDDERLERFCTRGTTRQGTRRRGRLR